VAAMGYQQAPGPQYPHPPPHGHGAPGPGYYQPPPPKKKRTGWYIAGGVLLVILFARACGKDTSPPTSSTPDARSKAPASSTMSPLQSAALAAMSAQPRVREEQKRSAAEAEQDRRDLVWITKDGYIAATTREKMEAAMSLVASGDEAAFAKLLARDPSVFHLKPGLKVNVVESGGLLSGYVKLRARGELVEFWTVREAIEQP